MSLRISRLILCFSPIRVQLAVCIFVFPPRPAAYNGAPAKIQSHVGWLTNGSIFFVCLLQTRQIGLRLRAFVDQFAQLRSILSPTTCQLLTMHFTQTTYTGTWRHIKLFNFLTYFRDGAYTTTIQEEPKGHGKMQLNLFPTTNEWSVAAMPWTKLTKCQLNARSCFTENKYRLNHATELNIYITMTKKKVS